MGHYGSKPGQGYVDTCVCELVGPCLYVRAFFLCWIAQTGGHRSPVGDY